LKRLSLLPALAALPMLALAASACGGGDDALVVYSGRSQSLVEPLLNQFAEDTGIDIKVRYGETAELAATILEEGGNSPADVFFAQDAGALGALAKEGRLVQLPEDILGMVPARFRSDDGQWIGVSGRARVVVYNTENVSRDELPDSIMGFTDPKWRGRIGWAPTNGSFQSFVTALRLTEGDDAARAWLEGIKANDPAEFPGNLPAVEAVADGEIDVAFVNHYYLFQVRNERGDVSAENYFLPGGGAGSLINVAGAGILNTADREDDARRFIEYLLSGDAQTYFAEKTFEYPLVEGVPVDERLVSLSQIESPDIDLSDLDDLEGTLELLRDTGVVP